MAEQERPWSEAFREFAALMDDELAAQTEAGKGWAFEREQARPVHMSIRRCLLDLYWHTAKAQALATTEQASPEEVRLAAVRCGLAAFILWERAGIRA